MNMLRVIASMDPVSGGPCQGIRNSVPALRELGVNTIVVSLDSPEASFLGQDDFIIEALGPGKTPYNYSEKFYKWLVLHLCDFDVVIIHGVWLYNSFGTFKAWQTLHKLGKNTPKVYLMPHGMLDPYFQKAEGRKIKALRNRVFWQILEKKVINGVDGILFTCEQELILARTTFPDYHPKKELNVGYGIKHPPAYSPEQSNAFIAKCPHASSNKYWLFLSRIHEKKGVDLLIKSYGKLFKKNPKIPVLVIAGPGMETPYGTHLKQLSEGLPVYFTGMLKGDQKWGALHGTEAFILPSHQENFGIAVVEAMACSKPVLISDQVNICREISDDGGGIIFNDTEVEIELGLKKFLNFSNKEKHIMGERAFKCYRNHFFIEQAAKKILEKVLNP